MKKILFLLLLFPFIINAQGPPSGTYPPINQGQNVLRAYFRALNLPAGCGAAAFKPAQWIGAGAVYLDSCSNTLYVYSSGVWNAVGSGGGGSTLTKVGTGFPIGITGTNNVRSIAGGYGIILDSLTANTVTIKTDSSQFATQFDISTNRVILPTFFDTIERKKIYNGVTLLQDFQHPTLLRTETGKILVGAGAAYNHAGGGVTWYGVSLTQGLTWGAPVYVETDTSYHYRNGIFSQKGDTITLTYWSAINGRIYIRRSTDDWVSYSARDSITSAIPLATENRILQWKGYNIMDIYTYTLGTDNIDSSGIAYKTSLTGGVWNFSWIQDLRGLQLDEGKFIVRNDTLFGYIRSDFYQDSMYIVYKTTIAGAWSVPFGVRVPHWDAGKPEILVMDDGRYLMNYRTTLPGGVGAYAISSDNGYTWDSVYNAGGTVYVYGSTLYMGDDTYMNVSSEGIPPYGDLTQLYFHIPRKGLVNSSDFTYESIGRPYTIYKHIWDKMDSTSAGRDIGFPGRLNVVATGAGTNTGLNIFNNVNFGNTALVHSTNALRFLTATHAAPGTQEQRLALFEPTATGTDRVIDIGDDTDPYFRMFQNGTIRSTKPFLNTGPGLFRVENSGGSAPVGAVGAGHEFFAAAGTAYWNTYNRTSSANAPLEIITSATGMTGTVTIKSALNLNPGVVFSMNGNAGTAGQVLTSQGAAVPAWVSPSALGVPISSLTAATATNTINNVANTQTWQWNSLTSGIGIDMQSSSLTSGSALNFNITGTAVSGASANGSAINIEMTGANASGGTETFGLYSDNNRTGSGINYSIAARANGGTSNIALFGWANGSGATDNTGGQFQATSTGTNNVGVYASASGGTNNNAIIVPSGGGSVGIGVSTTSAQLHTTGTVRFANFGAGTATFDASGNVTSVSDSRLKYIQGNYRAGLKEIKNINPVIYKWRPESNMETNHTYAGFSAQNIKSALGSEATGINKEGYLSVQDRAIMAAMVNAIKELSAKVDYLEAELKKKK